MNQNHELDLEFVKQIGGIPQVGDNTGGDNTDREFLNSDKAKMCAEAISNLFLDGAMVEFGFKKK